MPILESRDHKKYINILGSDGTFRLEVDSDHPEAARRDYETSDGKTGTKYELVFQTAKGKITDVDFWSGDYGESIILTLESEDETEEPVKISINSSTPYGEDFMKKLPNIDLSKEVLLRPFSFEDENGKTRRGINITQGGKDDKVENFYYDKEQKKAINGYPSPEDADSKSKDDWKVFFIQARKFLLEQTKSLVEEKRKNGELKERAQEKTSDEIYDEYSKDAPEEETPF